MVPAGNNERFPIFGQMGDIELFLEQRYACELSARIPVNLQDSLTRVHSGGVSAGNHVNLQGPLSSPMMVVCQQGIM